jgi:hypothetical protein
MGGASEGQATRPAFDHHRSRPLSRCHAGPRPTWEDTGRQRTCPRRRIDGLNLVDRYVCPDTSHRWDVRNRLAGPVGPVRVRWPAGDAWHVCGVVEPLLCVSCLPPRVA